jgi:hypothetical protein
MDDRISSGLLQNKLRMANLHEIISRCCIFRCNSALLEIKTLEKLTVPTSALNIELLREFPNLSMLAYHRNGQAMLPVYSVDDFWKNHAWISRLRGSLLELMGLPCPFHFVILFHDHVQDEGPRVFLPTFSHRRKRFAI